MFKVDTRAMAQDLAAIGKDIGGEINGWHQMQVDNLSNYLTNNSLEEMIEFYDEETCEFLDCLPSAARAYLSISIDLRVRKIIRDHCEQ